MSERLLAGGARVFCAVLCAISALITGGWIVRDLVDTDVRRVLLRWVGLGPSDAFISSPGSSIVDAQLLVLYVVAVLVVRRGSVAGAVFGTVGLLTLIFRAPPLWNLHAGPQIVDRALISAGAQAGLGLLLLIVVIGGRRTVDRGGFGPAASALPAPPRRAPAVLAFLLLGVAAAAIAAWQVYWIMEFGWSRYRELINGNGSVSAMLQPPPAIAAWTLFLLLAFAALAAVARAPLSRPVGMVGAWLLLGSGISALAVLVDHEVLFHFERIDTAGVLDQITQVFFVVAALAAFALLAPRGERDAPLTGWRQTPGSFGGYAPPPGPSW